MVKNPTTKGAKKLTQKQELAAQCYVKTGNKFYAYRSAYDCSNSQDNTVRTRASELFKLPHIQTRIEQLRKLALEKSTIDAAWVVEQHRQVYEEARDRGQLGVATRNIENLGKTMGIYTDNLNVTGDLRDVSDEDLEQRIRAAAAEIQAANSARRKVTPDQGS